MYKIKIEKFEGPLDLLSQLIEKQELDISEVSLAKVTSEFLSYIQNQSIPLEELADFLVIAAKLLYLKSKILLPEFIQSEDEEGADLVKQLQIYQAYRQAREHILSLNKTNTYSLRRTGFSEKLFTEIDFPLDISSSKLKEEIERLFFVFKANQEKRAFRLKVRVISLEKKIKEILNALTKNSLLILNNFFEKKPKDEAIVLFLAVLELNKRQIVSVEQKKLFAPIYVRKK